SIIRQKLVEQPIPVRALVTVPTSIAGRNGDAQLYERSPRLFVEGSKSLFDQTPHSFGTCRWGVQTGNPFVQGGNLMLVQAHQNTLPAAGCLRAPSFFRDIPN